MSRSGNAYIAATQGSSFTLYATMKAMGIPLSPQQQACQDYLEKAYPPVISDAYQITEESDNGQISQA